MIPRVALVVALVLSVVTVVGLTAWQEVRWSMARHVYLPVRLTPNGTVASVEVSNLDTSKDDLAVGDELPIEQMALHRGWVVIEVDERGVSSKIFVARRCVAGPTVVCARSSMYGVGADLLTLQPIDVSTVPVDAVRFVHLRVLDGGEALIEGYSDPSLRPLGPSRRAW